MQSFPWDSFRLSIRRVLKLEYGKPERHYHNLQHIEHVYEYAQEIWSKYNRENYLEDNFPYERMATIVAWHDFRYDVTRSDNEEQSALAYFDYAGSGSAEPNWNDKVVMNAILASADHWSPIHTEANLYTQTFLDADLAGLAAPWEVFQDDSRRVMLEYTEGLQRAASNSHEYSLIPEKVQEGRRAFFQKVSKMPHIYWIAKHLEGPARANIERAAR